MTLHATATPEPSPEITLDEIRRRQGDPTFVLVDALSDESYRKGHIPGAVSLPLAEIPRRARQMLPDRSQEIAVYCGGPT